jgi:hypothetical protein
MHDDQLERRLRATLRDEADRLPLTITAAELERRMVLRGRRSGNRRLMLLAAAVAIGAIGAGGILAGLPNKPAPSPSVPAIAVQSAEPATVAPPSTLPSLDDLIASNPAWVLAASSHGPSDGSGTAVVRPGTEGLRSSVFLGGLSGRGAYRVTVACLGGSILLVIKPAGSSRPIDGPAIPCDGSVAEQSVEVAPGADVWLAYVPPTSWRVVVRGDLRPEPFPTAVPVIPPSTAIEEELVRFDDRVIQPGAEPSAGSAMELQELNAVPARWTYAARLWCEPGASMRLIFGDYIDGVFTADTESQILCDGLIHDLRLDIPQPNGSRIFVAATPSAHWSVLVTSARPPVTSASEAPGWQHSVSFGPSLNISDSPHGVSMTAGDPELGDRVMVVVACTGTDPIEVSIDKSEPLGDHFETFLASCAVGGAETSRVFEIEDFALVSYVAPPWEWTAMTVFEPKPKDAP